MSDTNHRNHSPLRASRDDDHPRAPIKSPERERTDPPGRPPAGRRLPIAGIMIAVLLVALLVSFSMISKQSARIDELTGRFDELNSLIKTTDESLSESGTALSMKIREQEQTLETHWSEIKKLWGVSNDRNRKAIAENKEAITRAGSAAEQARSATAKIQQDMAQSQQTFAALEKELDNLSTAVRNLSSSSLAVNVQIEELESQLAATADLQKKLNTLSARMADAETALKALDTYRSQVNQQLNQLRLKVDQGP